MLKFLKGLWGRGLEHSKQKDEGYSVKIPSRSRGEAVEYREGEKSLTADITWGDGLRLHTQSISEWSTPVKGQKLSKEEFNLVVKRIVEYLSADGLEVIINDSPGISWEEYVAKEKERARRTGYQVIEEEGKIILKPKSR